MGRGVSPCRPSGMFWPWRSVDSTLGHTGPRPEFTRIASKVGGTLESEPLRRESHMPRIRGTAPGRPDRLPPTRRRLIPLAFGVVSFLGGHVPSAAQVAPPKPRPAPQSTGAGLAAPEQVLNLGKPISVESVEYSVHCTAARELTRAAMIDGRPDVVRSFTERAQEHAEAAVAIAPEGVEGHYMLAAAAGKRADVVGGRLQVRLAALSWDEAGWILERDSAHAGAHHLRGRVNQSVQRVNPIVRFLAGLVLGEDALAETSWDAAVFHLERAVSLEPENPMYLVDLAVLYADVERTQDGLHTLERAIQATGSGQPELDQLYRQRAAAMLAELAPDQGGREGPP